MNTEDEEDETRAVSRLLNQWKSKTHQLLVKYNKVLTPKEVETLQRLGEVLKSWAERDFEETVNSLHAGRGGTAIPRSLLFIIDGQKGALGKGEVNEKDSDRVDQPAAEEKRVFSVTGDEPLTDFVHLLWARTDELNQDAMTEIRDSLPSFLLTTLKSKMSTLAQELLVETANFMAKVFCRKTVRKLIPVIGDYARESLLKGTPMMTETSMKVIDTLVQQASEFVSRSSCGPSLVPEERRQMFDRLCSAALTFSFRVADELGAQDLPLSETLPILANTGISNRLAAKVIRMVSMVIYKGLTIDTAAFDKDACVRELISIFTVMSMM